MENLLAFQDNFKNKIKKTLHSDLELGISRKEGEISEIKEKYESQKCKRGFVFKVICQEVKNKDMSKSSFFLIMVFLFSFIVSLSILASSFILSFNFNILGEFFTHVILPFSVIMSIVFLLALLIICMNTDIRNDMLNVITTLTEKYERLSNELAMLKDKSSTLDDGINDYINGSDNQNLNRYDIKELADNISLSKEDLSELYNFLNKEDLAYLSINAAIKGQKPLSINYERVFSLLRFKRSHKTDDIINIMFKNQ